MNTMIQLTKREWTIFTFIVNFIHTHGYAPATSDIAAMLGKAAGGGVRATVLKLAQKGAIHVCGAKGSARAIGIARGVSVGLVP